MTDATFSVLNLLDLPSLERELFLRITPVIEGAWHGIG